MKQNNKALSMLSLATKAGKTVTGEFSTEKAVKEGKAYLVVVAQDASDNTKKKFQNMCEYYHVTMKVFSDKVALGNACGKEFRASLAVTDQGLAKAAVKHMDEGESMEV
ncbi:MAG: ribosomal L7Ae/L30e/S12e/Gadd45 family protein [Lachnospiraceae bacterium]|nr:ribosomal L7Ae/L30e/S12e/Gadd45 family protein [Lachnospiraceae bacterium]